MREVQVKLKSGKWMKPVTLQYHNGRIFIKFGFDKTLQAEIKSMEGAKWHGYETPPIKAWSIGDTLRNQFALEFLQGNNPFAIYDVPLIEATFTRPLREHQKLMFREVMTRRYKILAAEMGTGKTLVAIEVMEALADADWWYVAPKSVLLAINMELKKWEAKKRPTLMTYDDLRERIKNWKNGQKPPAGVILDEASKVKTPTSQRSQAAKHLAHSIRTELGDAGCVVLLSGTPAPKSPLDWWHLCEVACPGFLREGNIDKFAARLSLTVQRTSMTGGMFPQRITWWDDANKCKHCGQLANTAIHKAVGSFEAMTMGKVDPTTTNHKWEASVNEVEKLYRRLQGLVTVIFKKDVLRELPDKIYRVIRCKPAADTLRAAKLLANTSSSTIVANTLLRELSDGFQYTEMKTGETTVCKVCFGTCKVKEWVVRESGEVVREDTDVPLENRDHIDTECPHCTDGNVDVVKRTSIQVPCPKDDAILDLLDETEELGRLIIYAGFQGSIDRLEALILKEGWAIARIDGRGWYCVDDNLAPLTKEECLEAFDANNPRFAELRNKIPKLVFLGNPGSAGMGLTLTASPIIAYYSNTFNGDDRFQSEDRGHRPGMDLSRGLTIVDIFHLPSDEHVLKNLRAKKALQDMTLGALKDAMNNPDFERSTSDY